MSRRRQRSKESIKVFGLSFNVLRLLDKAHAQLLLDQDRAFEVMSLDGTKFLGIQMVESPKVCRALKESRAKAPVQTEPDARRSCVVLSKAEAESVAERRKSRTAGMSFTDPRRDERVRQGLPEMDFAERSVVKFNAMFPNLAPSTLARA